MSKPALCATRTLPAANSRKAGSALSMRGASRTIESVMPVRTEMKAGMGSAGVDEGLELAEQLAAAHLDGADLGDAALGRGAPGRLEVHDDERDVRRGGCRGRRTWTGWLA